MHYTRWRVNGDPLISKYERRGGLHAIEYKSWQSMKERCSNKDNHRYPDYGGRGITIYQPWIDSFMAFYQYIGDRPNTEYTLDRINVNGNYEPGNVKWSTRKEQANNRRSNIIFIRGGVAKNLKQWCELDGVNYKTVHARIKRGVPFESALY